VTSELRAAPEAGRRRRIAARTRLDFWFDALLLVAYTLAYSYGFTGIGIHEWLGLGMSLGLDSMFQAVNLPVLRNAVEIEVGVIAAVVILDIARRRLRRFLRTRRLQAGGSVD
jgi:hypothetical protein